MPTLQEISLLSKKYLNNGIVISNIIKNFHNKIIKDFSKVKEIKILDIKFQIFALELNTSKLEIKIILQLI